MTEKLAQNAYEMAQIFKNELGYDLTLTYGSLLGCIREGGFIQGDTDVDLAVVMHSHTKQEVIAELTSLIWKLKQKSLLRKYFTAENWMPLAHSINSESDIKNPSGQVHLIGTHDFVLLDLFTTWVDEKGRYNFCYYGDFGPVTDYFPLVERAFNGYMFLTPANPQPILWLFYGDWKTPRNEPRAATCPPRQNYLYL